MSSIKATTDRVIVLPEESESVTANGLIIPDIARTTQTAGTVISVGPGVHDIEEGDTVLYTEHAGASIEFDGQEHFSLFKGEIIAVVAR